MTDLSSAASACPPLAERAYIAFVQICKGNSDDAGTYAEDERLVRAALQRLHALESPTPPPPTPPAEGEVKGVSQLSDGYHTFAELYEHRHALMLAFMRAAPDLCWFSRRHADGELCFGDGEWFIVGAELPNSGTVSYHLPMRLWGLAEMTGAAELELGRPWDGHTAHDVVQRLTEWASSSHALSHPEPVPVSERLPGLEDY